MNRSMMSAPLILGVILALVGLLGLAVPYFTASQTRDVAQVGDLKVQATEHRTYAVPPLVAGGAVALGVVLIGVAAARRR